MADLQLMSVARRAGGEKLTRLRLEPAAWLEIAARGLRRRYGLELTPRHRSQCGLMLELVAGELRQLQLVEPGTPIGKGIAAGGVFVFDYQPNRSN